jgi:hypothetical protein
MCDKKGELKIPHEISLDSNGNVYVADRENNRIQVLDPNGKFIKHLADERALVLLPLRLTKQAQNYFLLMILHFGN